MKRRRMKKSIFGIGLLAVMFLLLVGIAGGTIYATSPEDEYNHDGDVIDSPWKELMSQYQTTQEQEITTGPEIHEVSVDSALFYQLYDGETFTLPDDTTYGYIADGNLYKPGTKIVVTSDFEFVSVDEISVSMTPGASIRTQAPAGLAFQTVIDAPEQLLESEAISTGMLITYDDLREETFEGVLDVNSSYPKANIVNNGWFEGNSGVFRAGVLNIDQMNYVRDFIGRAYVQLTYIDGTKSDIIYSALSDTRSITQVAQAIVASGNASEFVMACAAE